MGSKAKQLEKLKKNKLFANYYELMVQPFT